MMKHIKVTLGQAGRLCTVAGLLLTSSCFGTGVTAGEKSLLADAQQALLVVDTTLAPPAPAITQVTWFNASTSALTITDVAVPGAAKTTFSDASCPDFPTLAPSSSCMLEVVTRTDAVPGTYEVPVSYMVGDEAAMTSFNLTILPGVLRINDGAPVTLDARSTAVPVTVTNEGFDLSSLDLNVRCPSSSSATSTCTLDPNDCDGGLKANASCTARLITTVATSGPLGSITAGGAATGAVSCSVPISVASLSASNLVVNVPGQYNVTLTNQSSAPVTVIDVVVTAADAVGIGVTGKAAAFVGCEQFTGTCNILLTVSPDAELTDGVGVIRVTYTDAIAQHTATSVLTLNNATQVQVQTGIVLDSGAAQQTVSALNLGPWVWHSAGLELDTPLQGVTISSSCSTEIGVGSSYTANAVTTALTTEGASSQLAAVGQNLAAPSSASLSINRSMLITGTDAATAGFIASSTNGGALWQQAKLAAPNTQWEASLFTETSWVVVGTGPGTPMAAVSLDRGQTWQMATMPAGIAGGLHGVAYDGASLAAVGENSSGGPMVLFSSDGGASWDAPVVTFAAAAAGPARSVWYNGTAWVIAGNAQTKFYLTASQDALTWDAVYTGTGELYQVNSDGNAWLAVGQGYGSAFIVGNASQDATSDPWARLTDDRFGSGSMRGLIADAPVWYAVGTDGSSRTFAAQMGTSTSGATFSTPSAMGPGYYSGVARRAGHILAVGYDTTLNIPIIDLSIDGSTVVTTSVPEAAALLSVTSN